MEYLSNTHGGEADIRMEGKLTFSDHENFRKIIDMSVNHKVNNMVINMEKMEFIDSAGLGMLLLLREAAEKTGMNLVLAHPTGQIRKMFEISNFHKLFSIKF